MVGTVDATVVGPVVGTVVIGPLGAFSNMRATMARSHYQKIV